MIAVLLILAALAAPQFEAASIKPADPAAARPGRLMTVSVTTPFAVEARADGRANRTQLLQMLQGVLAERFRLAIHRETKELSVYALVPTKGGPKLLALKAGEVDKPAPVNRMRIREISGFARYLTRLGADRPVIDKTGLTGTYLLELDVERIMRDVDPPSNEAIYEASVAALPDQLGLRLTPAKASVEVLVIDRAEKGGIR